MMLRLYKFTCPGNYSVCSGVIIFATREYLAPEPALLAGQDIAVRSGITHFLDGEVSYLGTFMPATEPPAIPYVIHCETGEY